MAENVELTTLEQTRAFAKLGGRKFTITALVVLLATLMLALNKIDAGIWSSVVMTTVGAYLASNVTQKYVLKDTPVVAAD